MTRHDLELYILARVNELEELVKKQEKGSNHEYALKAGQYELLRLAEHFKKMEHIKMMEN